MKKNRTLSYSFLSFIKQKEQLLELTSIVLFYIIVFFVLKYFYPFVDGFSDSGAYIRAAMFEKFDGYRPYGYSKILYIIHEINPSSNLLVLVQYVINALASILFVFSLKYFYPFKRKLLYYIFLFIGIGSILTIYLCNAVLSDSLFASLTIVWITLNLWFINQKGVIWQIAYIATKLLILYLLVNLRYTGFFYFGIELMIIAVVFYKKRRLLGVLNILLLVAVGHQYYQKQVALNKKYSKIETFSGFSGWQSTNNALHVLPYIDFDNKDLRGKSFEEFALYAKKNDSLLVVENRTTAKFMWNKNYPMKRYLYYKMRKAKTKYNKMWVNLGANIYSEFGSYIQKKYPFQYFKHYIIPNSLGVFHPKDDQLYGSFNESAIPKDLIVKWFERREEDEISAKGNIVKLFSPFYATFHLIIWILVLTSLIIFFVRRQWKLHRTDQTVFILFLYAFVFGYAAFHIYASPFELRYVVPINLAQLSLIFISFDKIFVRIKE